jgi:hypothetical protein
MNATQLTIRTDSATKQSIATFAKSLGLSTGAFMLAAARESITRGTVTLTPEYDKALKSSIDEARTDYANGDYITVDASSTDTIHGALQNAFK